jgi:hypothetical protein
MDRLATSWKTLLTLIVAMFVVWIASAEIAVRPGAAQPSADTPSPATGTSNGEPPSNEIRDFPQLD